jgi:hypothetical protein
MERAALVHVWGGAVNSYTPFGTPWGGWEAGGEDDAMKCYCMQICKSVSYDVL